MIECIYKHGASFYTQRQTKKCVKNMKQHETINYENEPVQKEGASSNNFASSRGVD
jgi:hypothetical protein